MIRNRFIVGAIAVASLGLAGCSSASASTGSSSAKAASLSDFGTMADLEKAANAEGALNVIALPRDWANYGAILDAFAAKYPKIKINEASPDASSADEIKAAKDLKGQNTAPDVFDVGLTVALANTDQFAPYKVAGWGDIDASLKDPKGTYTGDYGGYMAIGYDPKAVPAITSLNDLLKPEYKSAVAINGDPTQAGAAFAAVGLATVQNGGKLDDYQAGVDFFSKLNKAGNFLKVDVTPALIASGEVPVDFDWDYLQAAEKKAMKGQRDWNIVILPGTGYAAYYNQAINVDAPHPAAARLWEEFLYTDASQNMWLEGGARPVRAAAMTKAGTINKQLWDALPAVPATTVVPTSEQSKTAGVLLGNKWASTVN
jgi:putative spermidine/putrescine transport system substrate-binding protein